MKNTLLSLLVLVLLVGFFLIIPSGVLSAPIVPPQPVPFSITPNPSEGCVIIGDVPSLGCISQIVGNIINVAFTFLGLVTLVFLAWGAIKYIMSAGDPKAIQTAQKTMTYAVIGAVIVIGSFILVNIVTQALGLPNIAQTFSIYIRP